MNTDVLLYPEPKRPLEILDEITNLLAKLPFVSHIDVFGSLARGGWDRWSDIDLIVATQTQAQFWQVWKTLHAAKPIVHHHPLSKADPTGVHILGNIFADESPLNCIDLNLFTQATYQNLDNLERFGILKSMHHQEVAAATHANDALVEQILTPEEKVISVALHFTKKSLKQVLRGQPAQDVLKHRTDHLRTTMQRYSFDHEVVGGNIGQVAHMYLAMAETALKMD